MLIPSRRSRLPLTIALAAAILGVMIAVHYHRAGLTLSHYDARGHLVVARRIFDSITPGWQQIGAVWLPLPHLLNALPVQVDAWYQSGVSGVAISIAAFALTTGTIAWIVIETTGSDAAAVVASAAFALNPNVLYLQATPMTEPLLLALAVAAVAFLMKWLTVEAQVSSLPDAAAPGQSSRTTSWQPPSGVVGLMFALACMTRYEAWPVTVTALALAVLVLGHRPASLSAACRRVGAIAVWPALAVAGFAVFSRIVVGEWFTTSGFFVPENKALGRPVEALAEVGWGVHALSGSLTMAITAVGLCVLLIGGLVDRRPASLVLLSLVASAALPWAAFVKGHPFRIRYMVPLLAGEAVALGVASSVSRRVLPATAIVVALAVAFEIRPLDSLAPMVIEAQWDRPNRSVRQRVTDCLRRQYEGEKIMASMGSLGHYMQEASRSGFDVRDFLHEGNGDIWLAALEGPRPFVGWILIEEKAEGGDMLARIARENPAFLDGYTRVCEGAGLALYRRAAQPLPRP